MGGRVVGTMQETEGRVLQGLWLFAKESIANMLRYVHMFHTELHSSRASQSISIVGKQVKQSPGRAWPQQELDMTRTKETQDDHSPAFTNFTPPSCKPK